MKLKSFLLFIMVFCTVLTAVSCGVSVETTHPEEQGTEPSFTEPVDIEPVETEPPHVHEYKVTNVVKNTCLEDGYEVYSCTCGLSYKNIIPVAHSYKTFNSTDGKYVKNQCSVCGDYKILRNQSYIYNITFDGFESPSEAVNAQKNAAFYTANKADGSNGFAKVNKELDNSYLYISECNFCVWDKTKTITSQKFVASMDLMFESYPSVTFNLFSVSYRNAQGKETYNDGLIKVAPDGSLYVSGRKEPLSVKLKSKGYNNISIVLDPATGIADVYVNEKLECSGVKYVAMPADASAAYIRYFDRKLGFTAMADNLKVYVADTPEFVVPNGITFLN